MSESGGSIHVPRERIEEIVISWNARLTVDEQHHMNHCPQCVAVFIELMDEHSGGSAGASRDS